MDIPRKSHKLKHIWRYGLTLLLAVGLLAAATWSLSQMKPAAPKVSRSRLLIDSVKRGPLLRQVRGLGTLIPEQINFIPAATDGRVERILFRPGTAVTPNSILLELSNPELQQSTQDTELQIKAAQAEYANLKIKLESQLLDQQAVLASVQADYTQAKLQAEANEKLSQQGLLPDLTLKLSATKVKELATRYELEQKRLAINAEATQAQLAVQQTRLDQLQALLTLRYSQVAALQVRAGVRGVLQQLPVEVGQKVAAGTILAKIAQPERLKAELKIPETQAKDIQLGQPANIDTHNGLVTGKVSRIDPAVNNGTVTVDVALTSALPAGARPDLSVDGTIELERLENILFVSRPIQGQPQSTISLFKLEPDGKSAVRLMVKLGRSSVNLIEVVEGLSEGNQIIISDMSTWDMANRVLLD
jgi:HlyD family secretion protein